MSASRPTPETDQHQNAMNKEDFDVEMAKTYTLARKLECERNEAREYAERCKQGCINLSFAIDRIDYACGEPNEFEVSDYALHQNEEHVVQRVKEKLEAMRSAFMAAKAFIDCHAADPDITSEMVEAYAGYQDALAKIKPLLS